MGTQDMVIDQIRAEKARRRLTVAGLAELAGMTPQQIKTRLSGKHELTVAELDRLAVALGHANGADLAQAARVAAEPMQQPILSKAEQWAEK